MARFALKNYLPRSLYGRAALILLVPILTLQLTISYVFVQRHFEGVTRQMSQSVAISLREILSQRDPELAKALEVQIMTAKSAPVTDRYFYDISGLSIISTLQGALPGVAGIDLKRDEKAVRLWHPGPDGVMLELVFDRGRASPGNPHQLLVYTLLIGALMLLIAFVFLRNQLRPIARLAVAAEAFGVGRSLAYKPRGATEVRAAGRAFLAMRNRIERQMEQRTTMLSGVSHDLRTPLTRLKLALSMIEDQEDVRPMLRDVDEMQNMIDAFLSFAKDGTGDAPELVDISALVHDVVDRCDPEGRISRVIEDSAFDISLRPIQVARALENLLGNAQRFGTHIKVELVHQTNFVRIRVEDDGPGISVQDREEALKPFSRLDTARNQNQGSGVGLGLAIAADVARIHGGNLVLAQSAMGGLMADLTLAR